ncbi:MAG: HNH endonuclease [Devosia sp.]
MKMASIKKYLRPQTIMGRKSTFSNAFASALAPHDIYSASAVAAALGELGQDPEGDLFCVYCGVDAATWDHVFNRVIKGEFSGHGHRIRNLVPCCRTCNERKGQKSWQDWLSIVAPADQLARQARIQAFLDSGGIAPTTPEQFAQQGGEEMERYLEIRRTVFELMLEADLLAVKIREKVGVAAMATPSAT